MLEPTDKPPHIFGTATQQRAVSRWKDLAFNEEFGWGRDDHQKELDKMMREASASIARALAEKQETIIRDAITHRLGTTDWTPAEIIPRMQRVTYSPEFSEAELYLLDRMPLVVIMPPEQDAAAGPGLMKYNLRFHTLAP